MADNSKIVFEGKWHAASNDAAMRTATRMHNMLRDEDDYIECRVILNVTGKDITLTVFDDATVDFDLAKVTTDPHVSMIEEIS